MFISQLAFHLSMENNGLALCPALSWANKASYLTSNQAIIHSVRNTWDGAEVHHSCFLWTSATFVDVDTLTLTDCSLFILILTTHLEHFFFFFFPGALPLLSVLQILNDNNNKIAKLLQYSIKMNQGRKCHFSFSPDSVESFFLYPNH